MTTTPQYKPRQFLTISELCSFARCPRKYFYSAGLGLRQPISHAALTFGECMHKALPIVLVEGLAEGFKTFLEVWNHSVDNGTEPDDKRNENTAKMMLATFAANHQGNRSIYKILPPPGTKLEITDRISDYEIPFAIDIGLRVPLVGRIDAWCQHRDTGRKWALEFKTTSEMGERFQNSFLNNTQVLGYSTALAAHTGEQIEGTMVEALLVAKTKWDVYLNPIYVQPFQRERWIQWARWLGSQILASEETGIWPQDFSACTTYPQFGQPGYKCDYEHLCAVEDYRTMTDLYRVEYHIPFVMPTVQGHEVKL